MARRAGQSAEAHKRRQAGRHDQTMVKDLLAGQEHEFVPCPYGDRPTPPGGSTGSEPAASAPSPTRPYAVTVENKAGELQTVRIPRGQESAIRIGQPSGPPAPIGTYGGQAATPR